MRSAAATSRSMVPWGIPLVAQATVQMHSDALEPDNAVSSPGPGNNGLPTDPGSPPTVTSPPPECTTMGCSGGGGGGGGGDPGGGPGNGGGEPGEGGGIDPCL